MLAKAFNFVLARREHAMNFASAIVLKLATFLLYFAIIPFFIAHQSHEAYGVIAFLIMVLGYSTLVDHGLTYTVNLRYVQAISSAALDPEHIIRIAIPIYALIASSVLLLVGVNSKWLAESIWNDARLAYAVAGMAAVLFLQVIGSVFASVLLAHNKVSLVNLSRMVADSGRVVGLFAASFCGEPVLIATLMFGLASALKLAVDLYNCSRLVGLHKLRMVWAPQDAVRLLRSAGVMWSIAVLGIFTLIYDKWYVSSQFSPTDYSYYSIANDLTVRIHFIFYALSGAAYTPLIRKYATFGSVRNIYQVYAGALLVAALAYYLPLIFWAEALLGWYLGPQFATEAAGPVRVMSLTATLYLIFNLFEVNLYTRGLPHLVVPSYVMGVVALSVCAPLLAAHHGVFGVAVAVAIMQSIMLLAIVAAFLFRRLWG